jgi:hypothetical protein
MKTIHRYREFIIVIENIDREWSEDAQQYTVISTKIKDECEGVENALEYAKQDIDNYLNDIK